MIKIVLPVLLAGIIMIAGIFAMLPIDKATTVHTTIQGTQLNNVATALDFDLSSNSTASCGASGGSFLVYYTFTNTSGIVAQQNGVLTQLGIQDSNTGTDSSLDIAITLAIGNHTSVSGVIGGTTGETITFFGNSTGSANSGQSSLEDTGDLVLTVVCQSGSTASATNGN